MKDDNIIVQDISFVNIRKKAEEFASKIADPDPVDGANIKLLKRHTYTEVSVHYDSMEICRVKLGCEPCGNPTVYVYGDLIGKTPIAATNNGTLTISRRYIALVIANLYRDFAKGMYKE